MKPLLVIGLGNPLMGDEGVGCHVADRLAADPRLPEHVEVISGGTDLLRYADRMEGRGRVVIVDAIQDGAILRPRQSGAGNPACRRLFSRRGLAPSNPSTAGGAAEPGTVAVFEDLDELDDRQGHAHHLSVVQAVKLLKLLTPARFTLIGISIGSAEASSELSPPLAARMPSILAAVFCGLQ